MHTHQPRLVDRGLIKITPAKTRKKLMLIASSVAGLLVLLTFGYIGYGYFNGNVPSFMPQEQVEAIALPEGSSLSEAEFLSLPQVVKDAHLQDPQCPLEIKLCPDRTPVGRTGPNCSFAECPPPDYSKLDDYDPNDPFAPF